MRFLRDVQVADKLGVGRSSVWNRAKNEAGFPQPVRLPGGRVTGWLEGEIDAYIERVVRESREGRIVITATASPQPCLLADTTLVVRR